MGINYAGFMYYGGNGKNVTEAAGVRHQVKSKVSSQGLFWQRGKESLGADWLKKVQILQSWRPSGTRIVQATQMASPALDSE